MSPRIVAKALNEAPSRIYGAIADILGSDTARLGTILDRMDTPSVKEMAKQLSKAQANKVLNHLAGEVKNIFASAKGISLGSVKVPKFKF